MTVKISGSQVSTQPNPPKIKNTLTQPNPTHEWTQPMTTDTHDCAATHSSLVALYDKTLTDLPDRRAPVTTKTIRRRPRTDL